jgi:hypothetical protein
MLTGVMERPHLSPRYRNDKNCTTGPESGDLAYSGEAAKKRAMSMMKVTAHQMTSLGMAEIIAFTHRGLTRQAAIL